MHHFHHREPRDEEVSMAGGRRLRLVMLTSGVGIQTGLGFRGYKPQAKGLRKNWICLGFNDFTIF